MTPNSPAHPQRAATVARIVWETADKYLRGIVEETEYGDYILPFTVLRRLECLLDPTKAELVPFVNDLIAKDTPSHFIDSLVERKFGLSFYNTSPLSLSAIAATDDNVAKSVTVYVAGFSHTISDIWAAFEFPRLVRKLDEANTLHQVVRHFSTLNLSAASMPNTAMGDLFEDVMYRAFDKKGKAAGAFYTPRDAIKLMVDLLFASDEDSLAGRNATRSIYDPTAGSGGMLLVAKEHLTELNPDIEVGLFGQELMDSAFALGKADLLIQGGQPDAIRQGDTLIKDEYEGRQFDYVLSNPPFGMDWSKQDLKVREQSAVKGSRFSHGLPSKSDGQMLFLAHCASKLAPAGKAGHGGRAAVVSNASPLFSSDKGPNSIRQWLFDEDLIDAVIALPTQMFYGTGIATYVWILDTNKEDERKGKIQLIDASGQWEPMRKPLGDKRRQMDEKNRLAVHEAYKAFEDADPAISRVRTPEDFMFRDFPVFKRARVSTVVSDEAISAIAEQAAYTKAHEAVIRSLDGSMGNTLARAFEQRCIAAGLKAPRSLVDAVTSALVVRDGDAELAVDRKGNPILLDGWKITERVPMSEDADEHMARDVVPFAPDALWVESKVKEGNEIPFTRIFNGDGAHLLRSVPEHWTVTPAWALFEDRGGRADSDAVHLTPSQLYGVLPQAEFMEQTGNRVVLNITGADTMKAVAKGDFIIHLRSFQGGLEYSGLDGKVSAAYTVLKPVVEIHDGYFRHLFKSEEFITELSNLTFQLRDGQTVNYSRFARMKFPVPPIAEQEQIAAQLDEALAGVASKAAELDGMRRAFNEIRNTLVTGRKEVA